ncbi:MAG: DUF2917 domain-containing protein [Chloroflexota bacterium]|nr:MAG: hypothetical protein DIU68_16420 [Chloroflexota bacterium]
MLKIAGLQRQLKQAWQKCVHLTRTVLMPGQVMVLDRHDYVLRMLSGQVWVSVGKKDILVKQGEVFRLPADENKAVITGLGKQGVAYEIYCETDQELAV